ncbi:hypothetical protein AcW1_008229 [Taiwanofungus camphoratus]|nr:hypothetical protein AcW1_008229 [Antrodia cinnamomea]
MSFSAPPQKSARTLRRTGSYLSLTDMQAGVDPPLYGRGGPSSSMADCSAVVPYTRSLRYYKEQRERRKAPFTRSHAFVIESPRSSPPNTYSPSRITMPRGRTTSPLAPTQGMRPARASFPRSKPEPDLYRVAITTRMRMSPEGRQILNIGPRLAMSILTATRELEKIVAAERDSDRGVAMNDETPLSTSWVVVPPEDWEMIDCSA